MALLSTKTGLPSFSAVDASIVNYFSDPGFERGTDGTLPSGWLQYNDGAVAVPVNGTGGSANASVTFLTTTAGAIRGTKSALLTKGPGNQQGTGYSYDFTISNVDKGVTAGVDFELVTSAAYVSGDVVFYIYDVTNSVLITPRAVSLPALSNYGRFFSDYGLQTGTQYRFILHIATTNASAWTITLDTMVNSTTRTAVPGAPAGNWQSWSPTTGVTLNATAKTDPVGKWRQVANVMEGELTFKNGTGGAASGTLAIILPNGLTADTSSMSTSGADPFYLVGEYLTNNVTLASFYDRVCPVVYYANQIRLIKSGTANFLAGTDFAAGTWVNLKFRIPIVEWAGSGTNFITDNLIESNARVRYYRNAAYSYTSSTTFVWDAVDTTTYQTNGNWTNSSGEISVPATGLYQIMATIQASALLASDPQLEIWVSRQGGAYAQERVIDREAAAGYKSSGSAAIYLRLGDKFQIRLGSNATVVTGTINTFLEVFRITDVSSRGPIGFGLATADSSGLIPAYATGTWTPAESSKTNLTGTGTYGTATYTRIGNLVFARIELITGYSITSSATNTALIITTTGLPGITNATPFYGSVTTSTGSTYVAACISDNSGGNTNFQVNWVSNGTGAVTIGYLSFTYTV